MYILYMYAYREKSALLGRTTSWSATPHGSTLIFIIDSSHLMSLQFQENAFLLKILFVLINKQKSSLICLFKKNVPLQQQIMRQPGGLWSRVPNNTLLRMYAVPAVRDLIIKLI